MPLPRITLALTGDLATSAPALLKALLPLVDRRLRAVDTVVDAAERLRLREFAGDVTCSATKSGRVTRARFNPSARARVSVGNTDKGDVAPTVCGLPWRLRPARGG